MNENKGYPHMQQFPLFEKLRCPMFVITKVEVELCITVLKLEIVTFASTFGYDYRDIDRFPHLMCRQPMQL